MMNALKNVSKGTILRTLVLLLAIANTSLQLFGYDVLPFGEQDLELAVTALFNAVAAITVWYKNNSFTKEAQQADKIMKERKVRNKSK